eukprot:TRINITY_DN53380_c0_g1_i1.p1 TRINITY_DN53380_c0_g1~~TRINITY_DN53380_c0_g1_i1.p1  ORF type:complete len:121 (+),score=2.26 TRINITY_DN53380_c0_g1_i1:288-650(+)
MLEEAWSKRNYLFIGIALAHSKTGAACNEEQVNKSHCLQQASCTCFGYSMQFCDVPKRVYKLEQRAVLRLFHYRFCAVGTCLALNNRFLATHSDRRLTTLQLRFKFLSKPPRTGGLGRTT